MYCTGTCSACSHTHTPTHTHTHTHSHTHSCGAADTRAHPCGLSNPPTRWVWRCMLCGCLWVSMVLLNQQTFVCGHVHRWKLAANSITNCVASSMNLHCIFSVWMLVFQRTHLSGSFLHEEVGQGFLMVLASELTSLPQAIHSIHLVSHFQLFEKN